MKCSIEIKLVTYQTKQWRSRIFRLYFYATFKIARLYEIDAHSTTERDKSQLQIKHSYRSECTHNDFGLFNLESAVIYNKLYVKYDKQLKYYLHKKKKIRRKNVSTSVVDSKIRYIDKRHCVKFPEINEYIFIARNQ